MRTSEQRNQDLAGVQEELAAARTREDQLARDLEQAQASAATERQKAAETEITGLRTDRDGVRVRLNQVEQERDNAIERTAQRNKHELKRNGVPQQRKAPRSRKPHPLNARKPRPWRHATSWPVPEPTLRQPVRL